MVDILDVIDSRLVDGGSIDTGLPFMSIILYAHLCELEVQQCQLISAS